MNLAFAMLVSQQCLNLKSESMCLFHLILTDEQMQCTSILLSSNIVIEIHGSPNHYRISILTIRLIVQHCNFEHDKEFPHGLYPFIKELIVI
jgi:hypothetical protein